MKDEKQTAQHMQQYFVRIPNKYIRNDIQSKFGLSRKFYMIYILIDRYRSVEGFSWITIRKIMNLYGYKTIRKNTKVFVEILDVLKYMIDNQMIQVKGNLDSIGCDDVIEIKIIPSNFDCIEKFTKLNANQIDTILESDCGSNKENILLVFLYIASYIGCRKKNDAENKDDHNIKNNPNAFWRTIQRMSQDLAMSKKTIADCLKFLTEKHELHDALLIKHEVGYIPQPGNKPPKNAPNIYVLNQKGYQREIQLAINKMKELYNVDYFIQKEKKTENT